MEIAVLSPFRYSSLEKKSKLDSIGFRPSCEGFFVEDELHTVCQEGAPLLVSLVILGEELDWLGAWLLWPTITAELASGLVLFGLLLQTVRLCQFPSVFPLPAPPLVSPANTPTSSTGSPSPPPPFWTSLDAESSSFTSLEFWLVGSKACLLLGEAECEEEEECRECLDNGEDDRSEWWEWPRWGLPERFWRLWNRPCE